MITDNCSDAKKLWRTFSRLTGSSADRSCRTADHNAESFAHFSSGMRDAIRAVTASADALIIENNASDQRELRHAASQTRSLSANKASQLDRAKTWLVKEFGNLLAPFIANFFNASLATGCFPQK
jgi:hypothetical protein